MNEMTSSNFSGVSKLLETYQLTGQAFLDAFCANTSDTFRANTVMITSLRIVESNHLFVEAVHSDDPTFDFADFCAGPTPCVDVITSGKPFAIGENVRGAYPDAKILQNLEAEAYLGLPLTGTDGSELGVMVILWSEAMPRSKLTEILTTIEPYLARISEELERKVMEHVIPALINSIDTVPLRDNIEIFRSIAKYAALLTSVQAVVIVHRASEGDAKFVVLAASSASEDLKDLENTGVEYVGTPCVNMIDEDVHLIQSDVTVAYPDAALLKRVNAESYLAFGFRNSLGQTIGHIAFLHNRSMRTSVKNCQVMALIASRAGQELQRYTLEQERDAMETALRVRSKLESLGTMAGTIAHDFNNQLTAMIGNAEMAMLELKEEDPARFFLKNAEESMWRARDVIADIMDFAGNHEGTALERVALGEVISSAISEFESRLQGQNTIVSQVESALPDIKARRVQIFQIISNLITNGLDALEEKGEHHIRITVGLSELSATEVEQCLTGQCANLPKRCIRLELQDQGRGMDSSMAERIFDPYFSTKGVSRGLGLSSVLGIAKRMQVGLGFETKLGIGTTFKLYFAPFDEENVGRSQDGDQPEVGIPSLVLNKTALVVDDEGGVQQIVSQMLTKWGYSVVKARSGEDAVVQAKMMPRIDAAVVDVIMPGMDGFETLVELRKIHPNLPAVIVSGFSEQSLSKSFPAEENVRFLVKPFGAKALHDAVEEILL
ncbi:MAG: response regulator [Roseobacter sp.]